MDGMIRFLTVSTLYPRKFRGPSLPNRKLEMRTFFRIHEGTKSIYCMVLPLEAKIGSAGDPKEESVTVIVTNLIDIYEITLEKDVEIFLAYNFYLVKNYKS